MPKPHRVTEGSVSPPGYTPDKTAPNRHGIDEPRYGRGRSAAPFHPRKPATQPPPPRMSDVTHLLDSIRAGEPDAPARLFESVYDELRGMAPARMNQESANQTLQPTALVHEAWLRLGADAQPAWQSRAHFFGAAAEAMRRILVDRARRRQARRRGAGAEHVQLDDLELAGPSEDDQILAIHEALERFGRIDPAKAELVKLRYFAGLTLEDAGRLLDISEPTAKRWWAFAKAWLFREISIS